MKPNIIISESDRPIWQIPIAAFFFTLASAIIIYNNYIWLTTDVSAKFILSNYELTALFTAFGIGFSSRKRIHVDVLNSRFKPTIEIGSLKYGKWQTIRNYQYVSIFHQPLQGGDYIFEVNLWYDNNKHFELYEENDYKEAFLMGYELSEELNIDLLDATEPNNFKWIDKDEWKAKMAQKVIE